MDSLERRLLVGLLEEALPAIRRHFEVPDEWDGTVWPIDYDGREMHIRNGGCCPSCCRSSFGPHEPDCAGMRLVADLTSLVQRMRAGTTIVDMESK